LPDEFFLLGIDTDHRVPRGQVLPGLVVEVGELGVAVGMLTAFEGLGVGLQAETLRAQQPRDRVRPDPVSGCGQFAGQLAGGQRRPTQRRLRVPAPGGFHQCQQRRDQRRVGRGHRLPAPALAADTLQRRLPGLQLSDTGRDPRPGRARRIGHRGDTAMPERARLTGHHKPLLTLVQMRQHRLELRPQHRHHARIDSHYHIMADRNSNRAVIYRQALRVAGDRRWRVTLSSRRVRNTGR
jgi:hypothetical protein